MDNATRVEIAYKAIQNAKEMIALAYKPNDKSICDAWNDITDEKIQEYYFTLNSMCVELADRNVMVWQKED